AEAEQRPVAIVFLVVRARGCGRAPKRKAERLGREALVIFAELFERSQISRAEHVGRALGAQRRIRNRRGTRRDLGRLGGAEIGGHGLGGFIGRSGLEAEGRGRHGRSLRGGFGGELAAAFDAGAEALDELNEAKLVERTGLPVGAGPDRGRGRISFRLRLPRQRRGGEGKGFVSVRHAGSELRSGSVERAYWRIRTKRARIGCNKRLRSVFDASGCRLGLFGQVTQVERVVVADVTLVIVVMVFADRDRTAAGDRPAAYACETFGVELFMRVDRAARVAEAG